jgi:hypothetical protein
VDCIQLAHDIDTLGKHDKMRGISWVAEKLLAFQRGLCSKEFFGWIYRCAKYCGLAYAVMNVRVAQKAGNFLAGWGCVSFPGRTLLRGVSKNNRQQKHRCVVSLRRLRVVSFRLMRHGFAHSGCNPREPTAADDSHMVWHSNELRRTAASKHCAVVRWNKYSNQCFSVWRAGR